MKDSPNLDVLRSAAVGLVLLSHLPEFFHDAAFAFNYASLGRLGVALFFVHTTLVLFMSLERHGAAMGPFIVRRVLRIYPLSIFVVLVLAAMMYAGRQPIPLNELASNLLLVQSITGDRSWPSPLWTLPYELQMYLFLPALYAFTATSRPALRIASVYLTALGAAALLWRAQAPPLLVWFAPCFLSGAVAFVMMRRVRQRLSPWTLFALVAAGALVIAGVPLTPHQEIPIFWAASLVVGLTIPFCRELSFRPLALCAQQIAKYSYGIYLTHVIVMGMTLTGSRPWYLRLCLFAFTQALVAVLVYRRIEAPGMRHGARLAQRLANHNAKMTAARPAAISAPASSA